VYSPADVAKALLMQSYFGVSNRVAAGLPLVFKEKLRLSDSLIPKVNSIFMISVKFFT